MHLANDLGRELVGAWAIGFIPPRRAPVRLMASKFPRQCPEISFHAG